MVVAQNVLQFVALHESINKFEISPTDTGNEWVDGLEKEKGDEGEWVRREKLTI